MDEGKLSRATREANAAETQRRQRIAELQRKYNQFDRQVAEADPEGGRCVLEYDLATKQPLVEVHPSLARRLKKHQADGVKFLYGNLVETVAQLKQNSPGTGAILAHCMGWFFGESLQDEVESSGDCSTCHSFCSFRSRQDVPSDLFAAHHPDASSAEGTIQDRSHRLSSQCGQRLASRSRPLG